MKDEEVLAFVKLVVSAIQTNHKSPREAKKELTKVLEAADKIHEDLSGTRIVARGTRNLLDALVSHPMTRI